MLLGAKGQKLYYRDGKRVAFKNLTPEELEFLTPTKVVAPPRLARTRVRIVGEPTLERLPDEILEQVALHLDLKSLSSLCKACFPIFLVRKENLFWKKRLRQDYGVEVELPLVFPQIGKRFQEFYQEVKPYLKKDMDSDWNDHTTHWGNPMLKINLTFETYEQVYRYLSLLEYRYTHRAYPPRVQTALSQYIGMVLRFCKKPRKKVSGEVSAEDYLQCKIDPQLDPFIQVLNPRGHILGEVAWYISGFFLFYPFGLLLELKEFQPFFQGVNGSQSPRRSDVIIHTSRWDQEKKEQENLRTNRARRLPHSNPKERRRLSVPPSGVLVPLGAGKRSRGRSGGSRLSFCTSFSDSALNEREDVINLRDINPDTTPREAGT